jgi:hypothetical protein
MGWALTAADAPSLDATDPGKLGVEFDTRRATFVTFVVCNCEYVRRIDWKREQVGKGAPFYAVTSIKAVTAADVTFANGLLDAQGFQKVK